MLAAVVSDNNCKEAKQRVRSADGDSVGRSRWTGQSVSECFVKSSQDLSDRPGPRYAGSACAYCAFTAHMQTVLRRAVLAGLWLHWGRLEALRRSGCIRHSLSLWQRFLDPQAHSAFLGWAHYRHALRVPLEEHLLLIPAAHLQDSVPGRRDPRLPRPGNRHHHQG